MDSKRNPEKHADILATSSVTAMSCGLGFPMKLEALSRSQAMLSVQRYLSPKVIFDLDVTLYQGTEPLRMLTQVSFLEKTKAGFRVGIDSHHLSDDSWAKWEAFQQVSKIPQADRQARAESMVVVQIGNVLSDELLASLNAEGLQVETVWTLSDAIALCHALKVRLVVGYLDRQTGVSARCCRHLRRLMPSLKTILITNQGYASDLEQGILAGATHAIVHPQSPRLFAKRCRQLCLEECEVGTYSIPPPSLPEPAIDWPMNQPTEHLTSASYPLRLSIAGLLGMMALALLSFM
jgi:CheY-like chemotaxis protein